MPTYSETWTFEVTAPEQETPEIPEETCDVEYKSTSQGVTVTYDGESDPDYILINVTIDDTASGDLTITLQDAITDVINRYVGHIMPGGSYPFKVTIQNNSGHTYRYKSGSFVLSTANAHNFEQTNVLGYDGQLIPRIFVSALSVTPRAIYQGLFGQHSDGNVTVEMVFNVYDYLEKAGYTGPTAFTDYVKAKNISPDTLATFGANAIFHVNAEKLAELMDQYPRMAPYVKSEDNGDGTYDVQFLWPEPELAALSYNVFYQDYWSFAFGEEEMAQLNPGSNTSFTRTRGIGDYMSGPDLYAQTDAYLTGSLSLDTAGEGGDTLECMMAFDGPGIGNGYMNYEMAFYMALELEQLDTSYTVRHEYYTNGKLTGSIESDPVTGLLVGDTVSVADIEQVPSFDGNDYKYTSTNPIENLLLTANVENNVIVLRYDRTVKVEQPILGWDISKSKTATPLDEDLESQVTLSLPSAEARLASDVVFVLDKSTSAEVESQMGDMLTALCEQVEATDAKINVGVVIFNKVANEVQPLTELNESNMGAITKAIETEIQSGTNTHAGLLAGKAMLDEDASVDADRKYLIFVSDGITYMYNEVPTVTAWTFRSDSWLDWAGPDNWKSKYGTTDAPADWAVWMSDIGSKVAAQGTKYEYPYGGTVVTATPEANWNTAYANSIDKALYETYTTYQTAAAQGYHCYAMKASTNADHPWASSFMEYLAGGNEVSFGDIQNDILYAVDKGSYVVDYIGYVAGSYDFDFVNDVSAMSLKVGEATYPAVRLTDNRYGFKPVGDGTYAFTLEYERGNGLNEEHFTWHIGEAVSNFAPVQLTYTVKLVTPPTEPGDYKLDTNQIATLHPVNSDGTSGDPEDFEKPTVDYTVGGGTGPEGPGTDPTPPGGTDPTPPGGDGGTDIPDGNTPTTDLPDQETPTTELPEEETPTTELPEEETPLAEVPETGDMSALWLAMAALSGTGLAGVTFLGRKKRDEE